MVTKEPLVTKEYLINIAKNFDDPEDFIYWIQAELGVFDESNSDWEQWKFNNINGKYKYGEEILTFIHNLYPGYGWFYVEENIWRESKELKPKRLD